MSDVGLPQQLVLLHGGGDVRGAVPAHTAARQLPQCGTVGPWDQLKRTHLCPKNGLCTASLCTPALACARDIPSPKLRWKHQGTFDWSDLATDGSTTGTLNFHHNKCSVLPTCCVLRGSDDAKAVDMSQATLFTETQVHQIFSNLSKIVVPDHALHHTGCETVGETRQKREWSARPAWNEDTYAALANAVISPSFG